MAKKTKPSNVNLDVFDSPGARVLETPLNEEMSNSFLEYAYSVITSRAIPDARDGLKPVNRRILYAMHRAGHRPDKPFVKSARIVGDVMGEFHPHGDAAIYMAMVRMTQPFALNVPLVEGHGNFGSPDDPPAASRYSEARMAQEGLLMVESIDEDTVDFRLNYSGDTLEPVVLTAAFPNLLVNGSTGIAVGMATNMIPHNLSEVMAAARWLITHPNATLDKLMEFIPGPDLPTGGILIGADQVRKAYETGKGVVRLRAKVEIGPVEGARNRQAITVVELPYGVGPEKVIESIKKNVGEKKLQGISDVKDLTDMNSGGTRLVIECKTGVNPQALLVDLYNYTPLEDSFGINNLALVDGQPKQLGLKELLEIFLKHRFEVVLRRSEFRRTKRQNRLHVVEGLLKALLDIDKVIKLIRESDSPNEARDGLMKRFKLSEIQANYILDTPLRRLTRYDRIELESEKKNLQDEIKELTKIINDDGALRKVVSSELEKVAKSQSRERKTTLMDGDLKEIVEATKAAAVPLEVADEPTMIFVSESGKIGRVPVSSDAAENMRRPRPARGPSNTALVASAAATTRGQVVAVTNKGRGLRFEAVSVPAVYVDKEGNPFLHNGSKVSDIISLEKGEKVVGLAPAEPATSGYGLGMGTRNGVVKVVRPEWPVRADEFSVIGLDAGDEVVSARWVDAGDDMFCFVADDTSLLTFDASKVRAQGLSGAGVAGMKLGDGVKVIGFSVIRKTEVADAMVATSTGQGVKVTPYSLYPTKGRATGGVRSMKFLKTRDSSDKLTAAFVGLFVVGVNDEGEGVVLPDPDQRRDGSGVAAENVVQFISDPVLVRIVGK